MPNSRKSHIYSDGSGSFPRSLRNLDRAPAGSARSGAYETKKEMGGDVMDKKPNMGIRAFAGFVTLVVLNAVVLWLVVRVLRSSGAFSWSVGAWDAVSLSALWTVWRSLDSYIFGRASQQ